MQVWINGEPSNQVDCTDRGFSYGDGLFETIKVIQGQAIFFNSHLARLEAGLARLKFPVQETVERLHQYLEKLPQPKTAVMKILISRGPGGRGYRLPSPCRPTIMISLADLPEFPNNPAEKGIELHLCEMKLSINPLLAGIKHLNRLEQVLARSEWQDPHIAEGIVCNINDHVVEGTMSNIFWVKENIIFTPSMALSGVDGIIRQKLIGIMRKHDIEYQVGEFTLDQLLEADEIFVTNSLIDIWPVIKAGAWQQPVGHHTQQLQTLLQQEQWG